MVNYISLDFKEYGIKVKGRYSVEKIDTAYLYSVQLENSEGKRTYLNITLNDYIDSPRVFSLVLLMDVVYVDYLGYEGYLVCNGLGRYDLNNNFVKVRDDQYRKEFLNIKSASNFLHLCTRDQLFRAMRKNYKYNDIFKILLNTRYTGKRIKGQCKYLIKYKNKQMLVTIENTNTFNPIVNILTELLNLSYTKKEYTIYQKKMKNLYEKDYLILTRHLGTRY